MEYDAFGRLKKFTEKINSFDYVSEYDYNKYDQTTKHIYPFGFEVRNTYANGYLTHIKNNTGSITHFAAGNYNGFGQVTQYTLGNGLTTTREYEYGLPTRFHTPVSGSNPLQDYRLEYDNNLNITKRQDLSQGRNLTENFTYDNLNRLKSAITVGQATTWPQYLYNANGNISFKFDAGDMEYP